MILFSIALLAIDGYWGPAYAALANLQFSQLRVVRIDKDLATDWDNKGFPASKK